jgi:hypothetical protein
VKLSARTCPLAICLLLFGCGAEAPPSIKSDPGPGESYRHAVEELSNLNQQARAAFAKGKGDQAAELIQRGETLSKQVLSLPRPTLEATEAASDLDQLYGDMLFSNRNFGWARLEFQKNLARWKYWSPQTEETARRRKQAEDSIAGCDSKIARGR